MDREAVRPALPQSYGHLLHQSGLGRFLLDLRDETAVVEALKVPGSNERSG